MVFLSATIMERNNKKNHSSLPPNNNKHLERNINDEDNTGQDPFAYTPEEDIYNNFKKESDIDPEDPSHLKPKMEEPGKGNEKSFHEDMSGDDLDVPASELDDQQEEIGSEDEENNYYSLGGDNHAD